MTETTARIALPLIAAGQAQKEMTHNEALTLLDVAVQASVVAAGTNAPPADPQIGQCWIVGPAPTGAWSGHPDSLAGWTEGGWRFVAPRDGATAWVTGSDTVARYVAGAWRIAAPAVATPTGGTTIDQQARDAIAAVVASLRHHGLLISA